jgi:2,3-bisphosphoglycerate-dependent phosphoglycerate mutase
MPETIKKIYIIRHGETEYNRLGIVQGSGIDAPLNLKGHQQAKAFYESYKQVNFDTIYTSTLIRTHQSVSLFLEKNINWEQTQGLNEISWGDREGKIPDNSDNILFAEITQKWSDGQLDIKFNDGESPNDVAKRQAHFFEYIISKKQEKIILIAMHGRALKILLSKIVHNDLSKMDSFEHSNLSLYLLSYNYGNNNYEILKHNDTQHLQALKITQ